MGNRKTTSILLFITAVLSFIGFLLHVIFFWMPYDGVFLLHRIVLSTTALLCLLCGLLIILDTSPKPQGRFESRFLFLLVFIVLFILMLIALIFFIATWGVSEYAEGLEMSEILEDHEETILIVLFVISCFGIILLLIVIIVNSILIARNWGELPYDS